MNSDEFFWRLLLATRSMDEAVLLWWLALAGADERPYVPPPKSLECFFGSDRSRVYRAERSLSRKGLISVKVLKSRFTQFSINMTGLRAALRLGQKPTVVEQCSPLVFDPVQDTDTAAVSLGRFPTVGKQCAPLVFDPLADLSFNGLEASTAFARLCVKRWNRGEAIVLSWLFQMGWAGTAFTHSSRKMNKSMLGLVDRRTMLRALERFALGGLVEVKDVGNVGQSYRLNLDACLALLMQPPMILQATNTLPGWSTLTCPLLEKLAIEATNACGSPASGAASLEGLPVDLVPARDRVLGEVIG